MTAYLRKWVGILLGISLFQTIKLSNRMSHNRSLEKQCHSPQSPRQHASAFSYNREGSLPSINPESERKQANETTLHKLIDINRQYLADKVRVGDVRKPSQYAYRLPSKTGHSEYSRIFARSLPANDLKGSNPSRSKLANDMRLPNNGITNYQSTYNMEYRESKQEKLLKRLQESKRPERYERKDGPFFTETSYHRDYHLHGSPAQQSPAKPGDHITTGGKFNENTTYAQHYASAISPAPPTPIVHKDHSIFVKIGKPKQSSYQLSYPLQGGKLSMEESCKPKNKIMPVLAKMKYRTEYSDRYVEQGSTDRSEFQCLSNDELKNYVLNILNQ